MPEDIIKTTSRLLAQAWKETAELGRKGKLEDLTGQELKAKISRLINSSTKTYRYVLPTQLLAKLADFSLNSRCLQAGSSKSGAFDARTIAHKVVVPFDQANENVLGGSSEPYVNNPLRVGEISKKFRKAQKDKEGWDLLSEILELVENKNDRGFAELIFRQTLIEIYRRMSQSKVVYPVPRRISLARTLKLIEDFLSEQSGGDRLLAIVSALFEIIGRDFGTYSKVRRAKITAADAATGMVADLECLSADDEIVMAVEVKDRKLEVHQIREKMPHLREKNVSEIFFIATQESSPEDRQKIAEIAANEFVSGYNLYPLDLLSLAKVVLSLFKEPGRQSFLIEVGAQLDQYSDLAHRRAWADLLKEI